MKVMLFAAFFFISSCGVKTMPKTTSTDLFNTIPFKTKESVKKQKKERR